MALEEYNMPMQITVITHRKNPIVSPYISQVTPSESSVIKRVAHEPLYLARLRDTRDKWIETGLLRARQFTQGAPWEVQVNEADLQRLAATETP